MPPTEVIRCGSMPLAAWRRVFDGAPATLDPECHAIVESSAKVVDAIVARGAPVYGINTGFGRLANVSVEESELAKGRELARAGGDGVEPYFFRY
jgi:histidine ammonia-lyase